MSCGVLSREEMRGAALPRTRVMARGPEVVGNWREGLRVVDDPECTRREIEVLQPGRDTDSGDVASVHRVAVERERRIAEVKIAKRDGERSGLVGEAHAGHVLALSSLVGMIDEGQRRAFARRGPGGHVTEHDDRAALVVVADGERDPRLFAKTGEEHEIRFAVLDLEVQDGESAIVDAERCGDRVVREQLREDRGNGESLKDAMVAAQRQETETWHQAEPVEREPGRFGGELLGGDAKAREPTAPPATDVRPSRIERERREAKDQILQIEIGKRGTRDDRQRKRLIDVLVEREAEYAQGGVFRAVEIEGQIDHGFLSQG